MQNYLNNIGVFYHLFPISKLQVILNGGLSNTNGNGIAVFRDIIDSGFPPEIINDVIEYAINRMLRTTTQDQLFLAAKLTNEKHGLNQFRIVRDQSVELTNELHNYIMADNIIIERCDIVLSHIIKNDNSWLGLEQGILESGILRLHAPLYYGANRTLDDDLKDIDRWF